MRHFLCCNKDELLFLESNRTLFSFFFSAGGETLMLNLPLVSAQLLLEQFVPLAHCVHIHQHQHVAPAVRHLVHQTTPMLSIEEES